MYLNKAIVQGRVAGVTEVKKTNNDVDYCTLSLEIENEIHHIAVYGKKSHECQSQERKWLSVEGKYRPSTNEIVSEKLSWFQPMVGQEIL